MILVCCKNTANIHRKKRKVIYQILQKEVTLHPGSYPMIQEVTPHPGSYPLIQEVTPHPGSSNEQDEIYKTKHLLEVMPFLLLPSNICFPCFFLTTTTPPPPLVMRPS